MRLSMVANALLSCCCSRSKELKRGGGRGSGDGSGSIEVKGECRKSPNIVAEAAAILQPNGVVSRKRISWEVSGKFGSKKVLHLQLQGLRWSRVRRCGWAGRESTSEIRTYEDGTVRDLLPQI